MTHGALELRVEGGRVSHSFVCVQSVMTVVGWKGAGMEVMFVRHAGQSGLVACRSIS